MTPDPHPTPPAFEPYISAGTSLREFTARAVIVGALLGMIFGASSLYLVLKVGLTVSASIPVAVIALTLFRLVSKFGFKDATILENNLAQTAGSAGESIAFGLGVTMPAILILGFDLELSRVMLVAVLGGLLGVLMMIPLRRALIVAQHGTLKFPEGTACAEVIKAGASKESKAAASAAAHQDAERTDASGAILESNPATIFIGFGIGLVYKTMMALFRLWKDIPEKIFGAPFKNGSISAEISPELLGVGYIIGPRIASIMCAGGVLSYLVLIPAITFFGDFVSGIVPPGSKPISGMGPHEIRGAYILYIGAGAVAAGGIISVLRSLPIILHALRSGVRDFNGARGGSASAPRTDRDLPLQFVLIGILGLLAAITLATPLNMNILGALLIVVFGFIFVTVSCRLTGEIGSSSNPISGMTVATLLLTCLVFLILDWTEAKYYVTALSVGGIVCIASSNGGTTAQSVKTGFLVGATPRTQQIAMLIGALASALVLGWVLMGLNQTATVYVPAKSLQNIPPAMRADVSKLTKTEKLAGPQAAADPKAYRVWHNLDEKVGPSGRYLVDEQGAPVYLVDPGINGAYTKRPDGSEVRKFDAPKATLMSYIIKGILSRELPWGLVLIGAMIAIVLEMSFLPSLAFATGVYLPLSSSSPIFFGGLVRWAVDRYLKKKYAHARLTEEQLTAEGDKSGGVLLASGYIAGGAIAGIVLAFVAGLEDPAKADWSRFEPQDFRDVPAFTSRLAQREDAVSRVLWDRLSTTTQEGLSSTSGRAAPSPELRMALMADLAAVIAGKSLYDPATFSGITVPESVRREAQSQPTGDASARLNRKLLEAAYSNELAPRGRGGVFAELARFNKGIASFAARNPFHTGDWSDVLALIPFAVLMVLLYLTGRDVLFANRKPRSG